MTKINLSTLFVKVAAGYYVNRIRPKDKLFEKSSFVKEKRFVACIQFVLMM